MSNTNTADTRWHSNYEVTADWRPYRRWFVRADGEYMARAQVSAETGISVEELTASLTTQEVTA